MLIVPSAPAGGSSQVWVIFSHACAHRDSAEDPVNPLPRCLSLQAALLVLVLCAATPASWGFLNPQLGPFKSGRPLGSEWLPSPCTAAWKSLQAVSSDTWGVHRICFLSLRGNSLVLLVFQLLETTAFYICLFFYFLSQ